MPSIRKHASRTLRLASLALVFAFGTAAMAQSPLKWSFEKDQKIKYDFTQKNLIKVKPPEGQELTLANDLTVMLTWTVKSVAEDGTASIGMVLDQVRAEIKAGPQTIKYNSSDEIGKGEPAAKPLEDLYSKAVGKEYQLKISDRGEILDAKVPEEVSQALQGSPLLAQADGGSFLSDKGIKNVFSQVIPVLSKDEVKAGEHWKTTLDLPVPPLKLSLAFDNRLVEKSDQAAKIDAAIETSITPEPGTPFTVEVKDQQGSKSEYLFKEGKLDEATVLLSLKLNLGAMDKVIEQAFQIDVKLKRLP